ncbi:MAG: hypothetical protein ACE5OP_14170 [Candidatus Glassbacteria bacterium]
MEGSPRSSGGAISCPESPRSKLETWAREPEGKARYAELSIEGERERSKLKTGLRKAPEIVGLLGEQKSGNVK